jgi:hypothetical protein
MFCGVDLPIPLFFGHEDFPQQNLPTLYTLGLHKMNWLSFLWWNQPYLSSCPRLDTRARIF